MGNHFGCVFEGCAFELRASSNSRQMRQCDEIVVNGRNWRPETNSGILCVPVDPVTMGNRYEVGEDEKGNVTYFDAQIGPDCEM